jgi:hypothetical protein
MPPAREATVAKLKRMSGEQIAATVEQRFTTHRAATDAAGIIKGTPQNHFRSDPTGSGAGGLSWRLTRAA